METGKEGHEGEGKSDHLRKEERSGNVELALGLIGGIIGLFASVAALFIGGLGGVLGAEGASTVVGLGWLAILASTTGIIGATLVNSKTKVAGWLMVISAVIGLIAIGLLYVISAITLGIAGILALSKKGAGHSREEKKPNKIPVVLIFLLLFTAFYVYTIVIKPRTSVIAEDGYEYIKYKGELIPLRATVGDCKSVPVEPSTKAVADSLKNTKRIVLLVDPYEEDKYYKVNLLAQIPLIAKSKYLEKPVSYAYTREYENSTAPLEPDILGLDFGNANHAVIQMNISRETKVSMDSPGQILISANESKAYDKAVCALELSVLGVI